MLGKTHVSAGVAVSLAVLRPTGIAGLACAVAGGAIGGWISDVDIRGIKFLRGTLASVGVLALAAGVWLAAWLLPGVGVLGEMAPEVSRRAVAGAVAFGAITFFGSLTSHRGFTHSLVGCASWVASLALFWPQVAPGFAAGLCSHLALDLLNKSPKGAMQLFFPFKKRMCLNLCRSDGAVNSLVGTLATGVSLVLGGWFLAQALWG